MFGFSKAFAKKKENTKNWTLEEKFELISKEEYTRLREALRANEGDFAFLEDEINEDTQRRDRLIADIHDNKAAIQAASNEKEGFYAVRDAQARGERLNVDDATFLRNADPAAIEALPNTLRAKDEKLRQEKVTITKRIDQLKRTYRITP